MCSSNDNLSELNTLNARVGDMELNQACTSEGCEKTLSLLQEPNMGELSQIENKSLCEASTSRTPVISHHRRDLIDEASMQLKEMTLTQTEIADEIKIEGSGPINVGITVNITEEMVLNDEPKIEDGSQNNDNFAMVDRRHWLAQPSVGVKDYLQKPTKYVVICHTATQEAFTLAENVLMLRLIQTFHMESQGWKDIAYNFCIGSDGNVYEGRGSAYEGSHTFSYNKYSIGIAFIGCFLNHLPPKIALKRCQDLIAHLVQLEVISPEYELVGHCQCIPFLSPGQRLFDEIKTWKNFNPHVTNTSPCVLKP